MAACADAQQFLRSLRLSSFAPLASAVRTPCPKCGASRKIFCYDCYLPVGVPDEALPRVVLPLHVHIIKHHLELQSKSTAVHAKILAPDSVTIYAYPEIPELPDPATTVLAFPSADAVDVSELDVSSITSVVFIDSTWFQAKPIVRVSAMSRELLTHRMRALPPSGE